MKTYSVLIVILTTFMITACSSEPSQDDIFKAMKKWTGSYLTSVKKVDCMKESDKSYKCNIIMDMSGTKQAGTVKLLKADDGWQVGSY
ncbi:cell wall-binding protein [Klebsiella aerogenes]|uniref:cell wall-binding protein n=1 Tax=Klebsiella aerogenes TaxID=548 RepID=UPI0028DD4AAD|nr:cell wall-binding protein [Klebsiella aerogenes]MDT8885450.1 cell wall-binding protein [Klebsiella aerogenes]